MIIIRKNRKRKKILAAVTAGVVILVLAVLFKLNGREIFPNAQIIIEKAVFSANEKITVRLDLGQNKPNQGSGFLFNQAVADTGVGIKNELKFQGEMEVQADMKTEQFDGDNYLVTIEPPARNFKAGKYTLTSTIVTEDGARELSQDFNWGVLAINTNKSIYTPGETAKIFYGVLNEEGVTICNAKLNLTIIRPDGSMDILSSDNGLIKYGEDCRGNNITDKPDYYSEYKLGGEGGYRMDLEATTDNGSYKISDYLEVKKTVPLDIERIGPTRINPIAAYTVKLKIKANQKFSGKIFEESPSNFKLTNLSRGYIADDPNGAPRRKIGWEANMEKGEEITLHYDFDAIDIWPMFYLLGPIKVIDKNGDTFFEESRYWQIASDGANDVIVLWDGDSGGTPAGWTCLSCTGGVFENRFPLASVSADINGGSETHTPTTSSVTVSTPNSLTQKATGAGTNAAAAAHSHDAPSVSVSSASDRPKWGSLAMISMSAPTSVPQNAILMFDSAPTGDWAAYSDINDDIITASASGITQKTGGTDTHSHTLTIGTVPGTGITTGAVKTTGSGAVNTGATNHTHSITGTVDSDTLYHIPPHTAVILGKCTNLSGCTIPAGAYAMFDTTPPSIWTAVSGAAGTFDNAFIEASASFSAVTSNIGSKTHTHGNATKESDQNSTTTPTSTNGSGIALTHTHTITTAFNAVDDHRPLFRTVIVAQKQAVTTVTGNAYADEATTAWVPCDGITENISLVVNGGTAATTSCADGDGLFTFSNIIVAATQPVSVFFNATDSGAAVTAAADATSTITLNPRKNRVWVKTETGITNITNTNLNHCDSVSPAGCANVPYDVTSGALTVEAGVELHIESAKTFAPGGNVKAPNLHVAGIYSGVTGGTETLVLNGSGIGACSTEPGTIRPLCVDGGTFTASEETRFDGLATSNIEAAVYEDLHASGSGPFQPLSGTVTVNDELEINPSSTIDVSVNNNAVTVAVTASISGTFTSGTGTKTFSGDFTLRNGGAYTGAASSATTRFRSSTVTLNSTSTWTKNSEAVVFDRGGGLTSTWTDSNSTKQDMGIVTISANGGNTTVNLGSSVKVTQAHINGSQILSANGSNTLILSGNGTPFNVNGTFTVSTGTVEYAPDAITGVTLASISYNNLTLNKASNTFTADGDMTVSGSGTPFVITAGTFAPATFTFAYSSALSPTIAATTYNNLTISGTISSGTQTAVVDGIFNVSGGTFTPSGGTITMNNGSSISNSGTLTFQNLALASSAAVTGNNSFGVAGTFTVNSGAIFTPAAANIISDSGSGTLTGPGTVQVTRTAATADFATQYTITNKTLDNLTVDYAGTGQVLTDTTYGSSGSGGLKISGSISTGTNTATIGGVLTVIGTFAPSGGTITMNNGSSISNSNSLTFQGLTIAASAIVTTSSNFSIAGVLTVNSSGNFSPSGGSTITMNDGSSIVNSSGTLTFINLTIANGATTTSSGGGFGIGGTFTLNNSSSVFNPAAGDVINSGGAAGTITGSGTVKITRTAATADYSSQYKFSTNTLTNLMVEYAGGAAQVISALTYGNLKMNNSNGTTIGGNVTVNGILTLTSGNITTSSNKVAIANGGSISRTSGHIVGNLEIYMATGATSKTFHIGDLSNYTPINIAFGNVSVAGMVTANTTAGDHLDIGNSGILSNKSINRYWTITGDGTIAFNNYDVTFNFVAGDIDASANTDNFIVAKKDGSVWTKPTVGARTSTSTQATGVTSFSDYQVGEEAPTENTVKTRLKGNTRIRGGVRL